MRNLHGKSCLDVPYKMLTLSLNVIKCLINLVSVEKGFYHTTATPTYSSRTLAINFVSIFFITSKLKAPLYISSEIKCFLYFYLIILFLYTSIIMIIGFLLL